MIQIRRGYFAVKETWRSLVDYMFTRLDDPGTSRKIENFPAMQINVSPNESNEKALSELRTAFLKGQKETTSLKILKDKLDKQEGGMFYRLLLTAGKLRAQFIEELTRRKDPSATQFDNEYLSDLFREIRLVPYRPVVILKSFTSDTKDQLSNGVAGFLALFKRLFVLGLFLAIGVCSFLVAKRVSEYLDKIRIWLIRPRHQTPRTHFYALWIRRLNPYVPWLVMLLASHIARQIVYGTDLEGIAEILPYFEYFFWYRIFRLALSEGVLAASSYYSDLTTQGIGKKIERTAKFVGIFFFIAACLLQATETVARKGLFYSLIWDVLFFLGPIWLAIAAYWWREELKGAATELLPESFGRKVARWLNAKWGGFICLPVAVLLFFIILSKMIFSEVSQLDSAKRISAQLFRRKLESAAKNIEKRSNKKTPPQEYLDCFGLGIPSDASLLVNPESVPSSEIFEIIQAWMDGSTSEHTIAIQGEKGIGKSSLLKVIRNHFTDLEIFQIVVPDKITDEKKLYKFLGDVLGQDFSKGKESLRLAEENAPKKLVLLDEVQNLFLGKRGGFEAFRAFIDLCGSGSSRIFWCVTINRYSWAYLNAVTGGSQYFRHVFPMKGWSDEEIRELIMKRHEKTGYKLEFDSIIFAMHRYKAPEEAKLIQDRYFELLWEQSRGNPRAALILWLSALEVIGENKVKVGLPKAAPVRPLEGLTEDELFVVAAIIRHENLTKEEACAVTSLSEGVVMHAIRVGMERGFLDCSDSGRFRIRSLWQVPLTQSLVHKNFVYG